MFNLLLAESNPALDPGSGLVQGAAAVSDKGDISLSSFWFYLTEWFPEGLNHILNFSAADHLLFILGLTFTFITLKRLLIVISFFTLAHGFSLAVVAFGEFTLTPAVEFLIEAAIALTIFWVAFENIIKSGAVQKRYLWSLIFGLIHGLGFAKDMLQKFTTIKMPGEEFTTAAVVKYLAAILGFNLGVDLGQILIALVAFYIIVRFRRYMDEHNEATGVVHLYIGASLVIALFGAGMLLERVIKFIF